MLLAKIKFPKLQRQRKTIFINSHKHPVYTHSYTHVPMICYTIDDDTIRVYDMTV